MHYLVSGMTAGDGARGAPETYKFGCPRCKHDVSALVPDSTDHGSIKTSVC